MSTINSDLLRLEQALSGSHKKADLTALANRNQQDEKDF
jgi:hypothetical protein